MKILIERSEMAEAEKMGFKPITFHNGLTLAYVEGDAMDFLRNENSKKVSKRLLKDYEKLCKNRELYADQVFEEYDFRPYNMEIVESDGWETENPDRLIRKFFYQNTGNEKWSDSSVGSFIIDFKENSTNIEEVHFNV